MPSIPKSVATVSAAGSTPQGAQRRIGPEPRYPLNVLLTRIGLTPEEFAEKVAISRATAYRRVQEGVTWTEADEWAVRFGFLPFEVWPTWEEADPSAWWAMPEVHDIAPTCNALMVDSPSRGAVA